MTGKIDWHWDAMPRTRFLDLTEACTVKVLKAPSEEDLRAAAQAVGACHLDAPREQEWSPELMKGALWNRQEELHWTLLLTGVSRFFTHQLVRARVGVTFSQQCTGDRDCRDDDVLVPRVLRGPLLRRYVHFALLQKTLYADLLDSRQVTPYEARFSLPSGASSFIYVHLNLAALLNLYRSRRCPQTQSHEQLVFTVKLREALLVASPWLAPLLPEGCNPGCWWKKIAVKGEASNMFVPPVHCQATESCPQVESTYTGTVYDLCGASLHLSPVHGRVAYIPAHIPAYLYLEE